MSSLVWITLFWNVSHQPAEYTPPSPSQPASLDSSQWFASFPDGAMGPLRWGAWLQLSHLCASAQSVLVSGCCYESLVRVRPPFSAQASPSRGLCSAMLNRGAQKSEGNKLGDLGRCLIICLIIGQNLQSTQVWLAVILVGVRGSFLSETSLSWWRSWREGPRCPWSNPGNGHILFIPFIFVWKIRHFPRTWNFQGAVQGCRVCWRPAVAGRGRWHRPCWGLADNTLPAWELVCSPGMPASCFLSVFQDPLSSNQFRECLYTFSTSLLVPPTTLNGSQRKN